MKNPTPIRKDIIKPPPPPPPPLSMEDACFYCCGIIVWGKTATVEEGKCTNCGARYRKIYYRKEVEITIPSRYEI